MYDTNLVTGGEEMVHDIDLQVGALLNKIAVSGLQELAEWER